MTGYRYPGIPFEPSYYIQSERIMSSDNLELRSVTFTPEEYQDLLEVLNYYANESNYRNMPFNYELVYPIEFDKGAKARKLLGEQRMNKKNFYKEPMK